MLYLLDNCRGSESRRERGRVGNAIEEVEYLDCNRLDRRDEVSIDRGRIVSDIENTRGHPTRTF